MLDNIATSLIALKRLKYFARNIGTNAFLCGSHALCEKQQKDSLFHLHFQSITIITIIKKAQFKSVKQTAA